MTKTTQFDLFDPTLETDDSAEIGLQSKMNEAISRSPKAAKAVHNSEVEHMVLQEKPMLEDPTLRLLAAEVLRAKPLFTEAPEQLTIHFKRLLQQLVTARYFSYIDCYFAEFITMQKGFHSAKDQLGYWLLALLVSRAYGLGHTALPYDYLMTPQEWLIENDGIQRPEVIAILLEIVFDISDYKERKDGLKKEWEPIFAMLSSPLVATNHGIYLERNYAQESTIVELFESVAEQPLTPQEMTYIRQRLDHYFPCHDADELDWQKFAAANAILNHISVISGGPGTGKTTTVFKILQILIDLHHYREVIAPQKPLTILLAAPTGKAAARLSESILGQVRQLQESVENAPLEQQEKVRQQLRLIPHSGQTLHRLLVIHPFTRKPRYNRYNPLNFDLLVVDEASMIDQQMLVQLIGALPAHGRVIFLGDKDQLASVEAGAIMHELCVAENYSAAHFAKLSQLLPQSLAKMSLVNPALPAFNYLSFLKKSYRFRADSALGHLAKIVNNEQAAPLETQYAKMMALIAAQESLDIAGRASPQALTYTALPIDDAALKALFLKAFKPYVEFLKRGQGIEFAESAFKIFAQLGVLSARRTGVNGAIALNEQIRQILFPEESYREFFHGLPIMVTHNSVENELFNGDIGLILRNEAGQLRAYFEGVDSARVFSIHALPKFETAFAMTIHKSQGSEFQKIMLFLGEEPSVFLTKELFYTGITRAKESVHIFANDASIKAALSGRVDRFSFIHDRLRERLS